MIDNLVNWFKVAAKARGFQSVIYDSPELAAYPEKAKQLQRLNDQVKINPDLELPSGFVLSKELQQVKTYGVPDSARKVFGASKTMAIEILDEILVKSIGIRLF